MRKDSLIQYVKAHRWLYNLYYGAMTAFVRGLRLFVKPDDKLILFVVFGGKYFSDSPRCIYEAMKADERFNNYRLVWAFRSPEDYPEIPLRVRIDTLMYFITALKARCWVTNEGVTRALNFKGKNTFYFYTTHTALPKISGVDLKKGATFTSKGSPKYDCSCAQSEAEKVIQMRKFGIEAQRVAIIGYPKNDWIANHTEDDVKRVRQKLGLPINKTVILYAPTFREDYLNNPPTNVPVNLNKWSDMLGEDFIVLYRAHHTMSLPLPKGSNSVLDVSGYPDNSELLIASDILVSDYSGIFFEFGVQEKPMLCYAYDYDSYMQRRGLYVDVAEELPGGKVTEDELLTLIQESGRDEVLNQVRVFRNKYISEYGQATTKSLDIIYKNLSAS